MNIRWLMSALGLFALASCTQGDDGRSGESRPPASRSLEPQSVTIIVSGMLKSMSGAT